MNQLTQLYQYVKTLAEADGFVNTITKLDFNDIDLKKEIIFPLLNVRIITGSFTNGQTINFNIQIGVFDVRDINKEIKTDEFWGQDNEVDNHNLGIAVLNRLWSKMLRDFEDNNITASENPTFELGFFERAKLLDGVIISFEVEVPNTTISLCDGFVDDAVLEEKARLIAFLYLIRVSEDGGTIKDFEYLVTQIKINL